jgi:hypothetical protein
MSDKHKIKLADLVNANGCIERIHIGLREGYEVDGDRLVILINTCINFLHDVIKSAEDHKVTVNGEPVAKE